MLNPAIESILTRISIVYFGFALIAMVAVILDSFIEAPRRKVKVKFLSRLFRRLQLLTLRTRLLQWCKFVA